jgi:hypothetical protein
LPGQLDDIGGQPLFVVPAARDLPLVERYCPSAAQARRSDTASTNRT